VGSSKPEHYDISANMNEQTDSLPKKLVVTLRAGGYFFALANIVCVAILALAYMSVKLERKTISVTGSARKLIVSDVVTWAGTVTASDPDLVRAYDTLKNETDRVKAFIVAAGIPESEITAASITTMRHYKKEVVKAQEGSAEAPAVITTDKVDNYTLTQIVSITSTNMEKVLAISRNVTSLIKDGVQIDSDAPRYLYTKLSELKINMLAEATKDATARAEQIVNNANGHLGKLVEARMGVMQINPKGVSATSCEGINDTTSFEKEITAVVSAKFEVK
jgi:uncharacterized protein